MPRILVFAVLAVSLFAGGIYYLGRQTTQPSPTPSPPPTTKECKVAGCNSELCIESEMAEEIITTCDLLPEYACYKNARCERQKDGQCGWTQDEILTKCLEENTNTLN